MRATPCPCQSGKTFPDCCGARLSGERPAETAEALMRSRYTAFTLKNEAYLLASWHPSTRPETLDLDSEPAQQWIGLQVKRHENTTADSAIVEFVARYRINGRAYRLHETSRFSREEGQWRYVDGTLHDR